MTTQDADKPDKKPQTFIGELARRHVFGTSVAYVVGAWVLIQVVDVLAPAFDAPDWTIRALTTVLILLLPLVLVLSWEYDVSFKGIQRTEGDYDRGLTARAWFRRTIVLLISTASLGAIAWVWSSGMLTDSTFESTDNEFPKVIAVARFQAFSQPESEWLGDGISNLVRDNLTQSQYLRVVSPRRWNAVSTDTKDDELLGVAADAGIRYLMQGEIISNRSGHVLTVRLTDTKNGEQLEARTFEVDEDASLLERATSIAQIARARLRVPVQERVDLFAADFAAEHPSAYRAFVGALDYWVNYDFRDAERLLRAALELQPDYAMAAYYLAWNLIVQDRYDESLQYLSTALESDDISERDRNYLEALSLYINNDLDSAAHAYQQLTDAFPSDTEARTLHAEVLSLLEDYDAALASFRALSQIEPEVHTGWSGIAYVNVQMGNYADAMPAIDKFARIAPDNPNVYVLRGDANSAQGDLTAAKDDYRLAIEKGPDLQEAVVSLGRTDYLLGDIDAALKTLTGLAGDTAAIPRYRIDATFAAGAILNSIGRAVEHVTLLDQLEQELVASEIFYAKALADEAFAAMLLGDVGEETAQLIDEAIENSPSVATRYLFTRGLLELKTNDLEAVARTAAEIRALALPPDDPDRTEDMAADFLLGYAALIEGNAAEALAHSLSIGTAEGYRYRNYDLLHAQALLASNRANDAVRLLEKTVSAQDYVSPRLDLEIDRNMLRLILARAYRMSGDSARSAEIVAALKKRWLKADPGFTGLGHLNAERLPLVLW